MTMKSRLVMSVTAALAALAIGAWGGDARAATTPGGEAPSRPEAFVLLDMSGSAPTAAQQTAPGDGVRLGPVTAGPHGTPVQHAIVYGVHTPALGGNLLAAHG